MNDWYFYQEMGKTVGPFSADDVKSRIKDGRIRVFDLLYREGEEAWKIALEHSSLRSEFKSTSLSSLKDKPWICLQRKAPESLDFLTTGPFAQDEVRENLLSGKIAYGDYAWKPGFGEWKRIGSLEEFNPRARSAALPHTPPPAAEETGRELIKNVVELKRTPPPLPERPPAGVDKQDLTKPPMANEPPPAPPIPRTPEVRIEKSSVLATPPVLEEEFSQEHEVTRRPRLDWTVVALLGVVLVSVILLISRFAIPRFSAPPTETVEAPPPPPAPVAAAAIVKTVASPSPAENSGLATSEEDDEDTDNGESAKPPPKPAKELLLSAIGQGTAAAKIDLRSDGSAEFAVFLQVVGLPGTVTEGGSFYRYLKLSPSGSATQPLDLSGLKLPLGKYIVRAETGNLKKEIRLNVGSDVALKGLLPKQRKQWAFAVWKDRLNAFRLSELMLNELTQAMVPTKHFASKGLEALHAVKRTNGGSYFLFEDWWELSQILKDAKGGVTPGLVARAQKERDHLANFSVWKESAAR